MFEDIEKGKPSDWPLYPSPAHSKHIIDVVGAWIMLETALKDKKTVARAKLQWIVKD